jgi:hypothetical protein
MSDMQPRKRERLLRPLLIGSVLLFLNCYWIIIAEAMFFRVHITVISLFFNTVFTLFVVILINQIIKKFLPKSSLSNSELLMIYTMVTMASAMAGHGLMQLLIPIMGHAFWYATPENEWAETFHRYLPTWLTVQDRDILQDHYQGYSTLYTAEHLKAWIIPVLAWTGFIFVFVFLMICVNVIVRKQWVEQEKLAYPVIQLPYEMIGQTSSLFRSKVLWIGFGIAAALDILNGIHQIWPVVPGIYLKLNNIGRYFTTRPWNAVGWMPISFYPFVIGMAFFIPLDLSFSLWFFFLFWKAQRVIMYALGFSTAGGSFSGYRGIIEQASGAYLAIFFVAMWTSRRHLVLVLKNILGKRSAIDDSNEPISYRTAVLGMLIGGILLLVFCYQAGMSPWVAVIFFAVYFALITSITRMRAEMGVPVHDMHNGGPDQLMATLFGTRALGPRNLSVFSLFWFFNRAHYSDVMPYQLETFKLAERTGSSGRNMFIAMLVSVFLGILATFWAFLHSSHQVGMAGRLEWFGWEPFNRLQRWIINPTSPDYSTGMFLGIGFVTTIFFTVMRSRFLWWPLHPAGYAVSNSWGLEVTWFPILISCVAKFIILRYGGLKAHRRAMPFFFGLILGEFVVGSIWSVIGTVTGINTYAFWVY